MLGRTGQRHRKLKVRDGSTHHARRFVKMKQEPAKPIVSDAPWPGVSRIPTSMRLWEIPPPYPVASEGRSFIYSPVERPRLTFRKRSMLLNIIVLYVQVRLLVVWWVGAWAS